MYLIWTSYFPFSINLYQEKQFCSNSSRFDYTTLAFKHMFERDSVSLSENTVIKAELFVFMSNFTLLLRPCFFFLFSVTVLSAIYLQESLKWLEGQLIFVLSATNFITWQQKPSVSRDRAGGRLSSLCALALSCPGFALEKKKIHYPP